MSERTKIIIDLTENLVHAVHSPIALDVEVRDYDWPRNGDLDALPSDHELVEKDGERYVRSTLHSTHEGAPPQ